MTSTLAKTVLVTPQLALANNGGIGTFTYYLARLLSEAGYPLTILLTNTPLADDLWLSTYTKMGAEVINIPSKIPAKQLLDGYTPQLLSSQMVADYLPSDAEIVYFADWHGDGFLPTRRRRYDPQATIPYVTVLHGGSQWHRTGMQWWPTTMFDLIDDFTERYMVENSDLIASPSHYLAEWYQAQGWQLPPTHILRYPFFPPTVSGSQQPQADYFRRLVFFGRLETRKGLDLFIESLYNLPSHQPHLEEIVFLGRENIHRQGSIHQACERLTAELGITVRYDTEKNTLQAQEYLAEHRHETLVVMPSLSDNFPFTVIELSLMEGVHFICSRVGGIPEILPASSPQIFFEPDGKALTKCLQSWLEAPIPAKTLHTPYDWRSANEAWLAFHQQAIQHRHTPPQPVPVVSAYPIDVCIPCYNLGQYLPQLLESLAKQTYQQFNVFIVDDGSDNPTSQKNFHRLQKEYAHYSHWHFISQPNQGVCATRNFAASLGHADYLVFMDADNVAAPQMIERFLACIRASDDDCLTCYMYQFKSDLSPFWGGMLYPAHHIYTPLGNDPIFNLLGNPYGDGNCIIKRAVFEEIGGFTLDMPAYVNREDQELLTILSLEGYKLEVIPEFLFYYRYREQSRLRTTSAYDNENRIVRVYEKKLREIGLEGLVPLALGLKYTVRDTSNQFVNPDGTRFPDLMTYLIYGVHWWQLLQALSQKIRKRLPFSRFWRYIRR